MFPSLSSALILNIPSSPDVTQKGLTAHVANLMNTIGETRLVVLPPDTLQHACIDCNVSKDPVTNVDVRTCDTCMCTVCNSVKCPQSTADRLLLKPEQFVAYGLESADDIQGTLGCLRCALKGAVRGLPKGKTVAWADRVPQMAASTLNGRMHIGCLLTKIGTLAEGTEASLRCPTCREIVHSTLCPQPGIIAEVQTPAVPISMPEEERRSAVDTNRKLIPQIDSTATGALRKRASNADPVQASESKTENTLTSTSISGAYSVQNSQSVVAPVVVTEASQGMSGESHVEGAGDIGASRRKTIDMFSALNRIDPRVACFNDIHAGLRAWSHGADPSVAGIELKRKPRTFELYFQVNRALNIPLTTPNLNSPRRLSSNSADVNKEMHEDLLARLVHKRSLGSRAKIRPEVGLKRNRELTASGMVLSQVFNLSPEEAEDISLILGQPIVECLVEEDDLKRIRRSDEGAAKRKATINRTQARVSTGTLGEAPFVLARAKRLAEMQRQWEDVAVGLFDSEEA